MTDLPDVPKRTDGVYIPPSVRYTKSVQSIGTWGRGFGRVFQGSGDLGKKMIEVEIDMKIVSVANIRMHWAVKAKLTKGQRQKAFNALCAVGAPMPLPCTIVLTRVAPRGLDGDNLQSAFKATRDGVADWLGVDDGDPRLDWQYRQRKGLPKVYRVEIEVI